MPNNYLQSLQEKGILDSNIDLENINLQEICRVSTALIKPYENSIEEFKGDINIYFLVKELIFKENDNLLTSFTNKIKNLLLNMSNEMQDSYELLYPRSNRQNSDQDPKLLIDKINAAYESIYSELEERVLNQINSDINTKAKDTLKYILDKINFHEKVQNQFIISAINHSRLTQNKEPLKNITISNYTDSGVNWDNHRKNIESFSQDLANVLLVLGASLGAVGGIVGFGLVGPFLGIPLVIVSFIAGGLVGAGVGAIVGEVVGSVVSAIVGGVQALYNTLNYSFNKKSYLKSHDNSVGNNNEVDTKKEAETKLGSESSVDSKLIAEIDLSNSNSDIKASAELEKQDTHHKVSINDKVLSRKSKVVTPARDSATSEDKPSSAGASTSSKNNPNA